MYQQSGRQYPVGGTNGQNSTGFYDIIDQKQNKTNSRVKTEMEDKFLIE
jgi:hypothetical protein